MKEDKHILKDITAALNRNDIAEVAAEITWRSALKEVLKQTKKTNRGRIGIIDWIEKELEG